jgi:DNA-binding transcriptional ArsR family regulator
MLDETFASLADPTRRAILQRLTRETEVAVGDLAKPFSRSLPSIIKHLDVLEHAGLIVRERRGRNVCCRLKPAPMTQAHRWLERNLSFWEKRLEQLADVVEGRGP